MTALLWLVSRGPSSRRARGSAILFPARMAAAFFATYQGETLAAAMVVFFGPRATYLYSASRREHRQMMAPSALQAGIMAEAIERGCATHDLYGIDVQGDQNDHIFSRGSADSKAALAVFLAALEPGREHLTTAPRRAEIPERDGSAYEL